jgi:pyruvate dehydrogenase E2 component (dihydrolipoamide acetyltransferase)
MAEVIRMPRLSDTMTEGVIAEWHKKVGDKVKPGDVLADVETDKATMELESYNEGTLLYIGVEKGSAVKIDGILAVIGKEGENYQDLLKGDNSSVKPATTNPTRPEESNPLPPENDLTKLKSPEPAKEKQEQSSEKVSLPEGAKEIRMPLLSDTMSEGKIIAWHKKVGDKVKSDDVLAEVETDKATMEVVGYEEGTLLYVGVDAGNAAKINEIIAIVGKPGTDVSAYVASEKNAGNNVTSAPAEKSKEAAAPEKKEVAATPEELEKDSDGRIKASPLAKKIAAEKGIDLKQLAGTGDGGRIVKKDIETFKPQAQTARAAVNAQTPAAGEESFSDTPLTQMRKTIARRLGESKFSAPHFYLTMEINMDNAMKARESLNVISDVKISFNDMLIKACAVALLRHPDVNSSFMGDFIRHNNHINIGSAVAMPEGLIVPVIKSADKKTLSQIAKEAKELYTKAREKKLQPHEFSGNTFTISNLGMMDIEEFTAIINPPDSCILAVGKIKEVVVSRNKNFEVTHVMKVTMSCDHRSVDGAVGAAFLHTLKQLMQDPVTMLL